MAVDSEKIWITAQKIVHEYATALDLNSSAPWFTGSGVELIQRIFKEANNHNHFAIMARFHDEWLVAMLKEGWGWAEEFNLEDKKDPHLLPFSQIPLERQMCAMFFRQVVISFSAVYAGH